ncbi:hypothetical protein [Amycolatopsis sp. NPDC004378]
MAVSTLMHLNFTGNARSALEFYQSVFGGHLMIMEHGTQLDVQTEGATPATCRWPRTTPTPGVSPSA